jgi:uncharacterized protein involved in outer membrane biogenesis
MVTTLSHLSRVLLWIGATLFSLLALAILYLALFGWNWLRSPLERIAADKTGRTLTLQGDLKVNIAWPAVRLRAAQVRFANPAWAQEPQMLNASGVEVTVDLPALVQRKLLFPEVTLDQAIVFLEQSADDRKSWLLDLNQKNEEARIQIGHVALNRGTLGFDDAKQKTHIRAKLNTAPKLAAGDATAELQFSAVGQYKGLVIQVRGSGGPVVALRDTTRPYPLVLHASAGKTAVQLKGSVTGLLTLTAVDMHMQLSGNSLEQLYPLLGIPFPETRGYATQGHLSHAGTTWRYDQFIGKVGASDLAGFVQVTTGGKRAMLTADLRSKLLDLADLGPVIGSGPVSLTKTGAIPRAGNRLLPGLPFNSERWGAVDADVWLHAMRLRRNMALPLDKLDSHLLMRDSVVTLDPLSFGLAGGQLSAKITLDGRSHPILAHAQVRARKVLLAKLFPAFDLSTSSIGQVNGEFDLTGTGDSVGTMLAHADGKLGLVVTSGQISKLMMEKAGLHLWEILNLSLTGDRLVKLRCAVADFSVTQGVMRTQALVLDTQVTTLIGTGSINLRQEQLDLTLNPKTKMTSPVSFHSPIYIRGRFVQPQISIDKGSVVARAAGAVALAMVNPLLALIPLVDAGPGVDSDCKQLVRDARAWPRIQHPSRP